KRLLQVVHDAFQVGDCFLGSAGVHDSVLQFGRAHCRASCWAISVRYTWSAIPMPPALANDFAYSSVSIERQTPVAPPPPNGPSPSMPVNMCWNIELRNTDSKSCAAARAFVSLPGPGVLPENMLFVSMSSGLEPGAGIVMALAITSPRCRPGLHRRL